MEDKRLTGYPSIDKPWMKHWPSFLLEGRQKYERIIDNIRAVWTNPDEVIVNFYDTEITVKDFFEKVYAIARSLHAMGVREGDSVAVSLEAVPEFMELFLACEMLGCAVKNFLETGLDNIELINTCSADVYIAHDYITNSDVELVYNHTHIRHVILVDPLYSAINADGIRPHIRMAVEERYVGKEKSVNTKNMSWNGFLKQGEDIDSLPDVQKGHVVFSAFTSGTTGKCKEVLHTSEALLGVIRQIALIQAAEGKRPSWLLSALPPTLVACVCAVMWQPLASGKYLILDPFCRLQDLDLEIMHFRPDAWSAIPLFFELLLDSERIPDDYDMSHLVQFGIGAETLTSKLAEKIQAFFDKHNCHAAVCNSYGLSEAGSGCTIAIGKDLVMTGTSGIPYIETIMSIFEPGTSKELKYGEIGEVCKAGPGLMKGYADPELTRKVLKEHPDGQLWLHTGDYGFMTEQGLLFVLGRDAIPVHPDKHVFSLRIEGKVLSHAAIRHAVIIPGKDEEHEGFEKLHLFIVLENGYEETDVLPELWMYIDRVLLPEEKPERIIVLEKLPIRGFKTDRRYLKEAYGI